MTLEIRWFFPGTIPENEVEDWFLDNPRFGERLTEKHGKTREDIYLLTPGNSDIGAKLREGKFEIKLRQVQQEFIDLAGGVSGKSEVWHKWKWPYARTKKDKKINEVVTNSFLARTPEKLRVTIWKQRWQRKFKPASPEDLDPVPKSQKDLSWRISAELTGLQIKGGTLVDHGDRSLRKP